MKRWLIAMVTLVCVLSAGIPTAVAAAPKGAAAAAIADCYANNRLTHNYSVATLRVALAEMPADVREYSDCYDVIERQLFKQLGTQSPGGPGGGSGGSGDSGGSFLPTWLLVVIVLLALGATTFGALAIRRRAAPPAARGGPEDPGGAAQASDRPAPGGQDAPPST